MMHEVATVEANPLDVPCQHSSQVHGAVGAAKLVSALLLVGLACLNLGCAAPSSREVDSAGSDASFTEQQRQAVEAEVRAVFETFVAAESAGDLLANAKYFADSPDFRWYEEGALQYRSRAEVRSAREAAASYGALETSYTDVEVTPWSLDAALLSAAFATTIGDPEQGGFSFSGRMTIDVVRIMEPAAGEPAWQFLVGHTSTRSQDPERRS